MSWSARRGGAVETCEACEDLDAARSIAVGAPAQRAPLTMLVRL